MRGFLTLLIAGTLSGSQHYGYVRSGNKAIPGAAVTASLDQWKLATTTDETGMYIFDLPGWGKWVFQAEMFGFSAAREERTLTGGSSVLDFDLQLQAAGVAETPATAPAAGFQTVDVEEQADSRAQIEQQLEAAAAAPMAQPTGGADVNQAFLVNGSLSGGLQSVQQENFFDQLDRDQTDRKSVV